MRKYNRVSPIEDDKPERKEERGYVLFLCAWYRELTVTNTCSLYTVSSQRTGIKEEMKRGKKAYSRTSLKRTPSGPEKVSA